MGGGMQARWIYWQRDSFARKNPIPKKKKARREDPGFLNLALATLRCRGRAQTLDWEEDRVCG
jgi:hypothetical protein